MVATKMPRKNLGSYEDRKVGQKLPVNTAKLKKKAQIASEAPIISNRPRRFSLIYSSDSSLTDVPEEGNRRVDLGVSAANRRHGKVKSISNNATGKRSKLIHQSSNSDNESTDSSNYQAVASDNNNDYGVDEGDENSSDSDSESDSDSDSGSDSDSELTSSDDETIDFVKLTAQRKKRAMKALSALKRSKSPTKSAVNDEKRIGKNKENRVSTQVQDSTSDPASESDYDSNQNSGSSSDNEGSGVDNNGALAFNFRKDDDGIRYGRVSNQGSEEDIGEEVKESNEIQVSALENDNLNRFNVPEFSASEESEYDIDQDAYFNVIDDENISLNEMDTGLETGEDELPLLQEEEKNLVSQLQDDDELSFDGSIHESGSDPAERSRNENKNKDEEYDDEDEEMTIFDMPFYEDPKFASLYYCEDGNEPRLSLSTSLPLLITDEKRLKLKRREAKKIERKELMERRRNLKQGKNKGLKVDVGEYIFGVFFQDENEDDDHDHDGRSREGKRRVEFNKNLDLESPLRRLGSAAASDASSDDEYENILLDIAHLPSEDDDYMDEEKKEDLKDSSGSVVKVEEIERKDYVPGDSEIDMDADEGYDDDDDDDDDMTDTNVFIDIDDLDPDSFYFQALDDENSSSFSETTSDDTDLDDKKISKDEVTETIVYVDDESTDEDDNLPSPSAQSKAIGSKAKEVVSANIVGLRPPKLGTWETDSKPFTIIDGLSTKSLYPLIQEHQQFLEQQRAQSQSPDAHSMPDLSPANGDELTLNELLNMSELEDEESAAPSYSKAVSDWYKKPTVPLSAFRNKGVNSMEEDEYMLPANSTRKVPIGYIGTERTRRKIDKMKELQRKKSEKRRKLKKRKKLLKLKRERERMDKENSLLSEKTPELDAGALIDTLHPFSEIESQTDNFKKYSIPASERKNSAKSVGLEEINEILGKDNSDLSCVYDIPATGADLIGISDADIVTSLTAPIQLTDFESGSSWRRRQSMVEAAAENLRFTKNGLFSESALADIEGIIGNGPTSGAFEFNEALQ
ncbi:hypothetical protein HG535_0F04800 [Zygotorulaspora mrakii]|uniref:Protein IFH1 n=1 Tax=Zygotorulaspora mrakii TaxID=42260 RepID=A0A7H9B5I7_ZYGMR|nr:uncharacterized protein HG535_0F04800 [Zygotorulaspora mrakii]QLG73968.1 hypothetical protein HG535_0F04800 [Zygotorulaspora mrakii]